MVRHATLDYNSKDADSLSAAGKLWASNLEATLQNECLYPEYWLYDASKKPAELPILRCLDTIANASVSKNRSGYDQHEIRNKIAKLFDIDLLAICYTSESLKHFPEIVGTPNIDQSVRSTAQSDYLYTHMALFEYRDSKLHHLRDIPTQEKPPTR